MTANVREHTAQKKNKKKKKRKKTYKLGLIRHEVTISPTAAGG